MQLDCQLRAFDVEVTASSRIVFLLCSYGWFIGLGTSLGMLEGTTSGNMALLLLLFWSAEDRVVLSSISWQSRFPLFILGHFFLLGIGLKPNMKWARLCQIPQPHNNTKRFSPLKKKKKLVSSPPLALCNF